MKVSFDEFGLSAQIYLEPETVKELSSLARLALNAKREPPTMRLEFTENGDPCFYVWFRKRARISQTNSIKP